jgi:hypothetical protein
MIRKVARYFGKWPHEFEYLDVYQQNLALLCVLDHEAAMLDLADRSGAFPVISASEVA